MSNVMKAINLSVMINDAKYEGIRKEMKTLIPLCFLVLFLCGDVQPCITM